MNREEVEHAIAELTGAWRGSRTLPALDTWRSVLLKADTVIAARTIVRLIDTCKHAPSIAEFREAYAAIESSIEPEAKARRADRSCPLCGGIGWQEGPPERYEPSQRQAAADAAEEARARKSGKVWLTPVYERSTVVPCPCSPAAEAVHRRILNGGR